MAILPAAIGIILNEDQTQVLLVKRTDTPVWVLPGGGIELHESPEEALLREVEEETGLKVKIIRKSAEYYPINKLSTLTLVFLCEIITGQLRSSKETEIVAFYPLNYLPSMFFPIHANWLKEILNSPQFIQRSLKETSYYLLLKYFIQHPWISLKYLWTRLIQK